MAFDKNIPKQRNSELQLQQPNLTQLGFNSVSRMGNATKISRKTKNQFQILIEKAPVSIFVIQEEKICYANPIAKLTTGYSQFHSVGSLYKSQRAIDSSFYHQLNPNRYTLDNLMPNHCEETKIRFQGDRDNWFNCCWSTIEWQCQPAIMITAIDITKYKQQEAKIDQVSSSEKELCQNEASLVAMVSHEFRTPLNIISFSTSLLKRHLNQWNEAKQLKYLDRLQTAVEQLSNLMDEVLIIGKVDAGKLKFNPQLLNLNLFCHNLLVEMNLSWLNCAKIKFVNRLDRETILADKNLLKLVLVNLLGNAIKYSPDGSTVEFIVSCDCQQIIFEIIDRGIGISADRQSKIFEPFYRGNNVGDLPGNGLGLAITKKIVDLQNGQIFLESEIEIGSTFTVKIPLESPQI